MIEATRLLRRAPGMPRLVHRSSLNPLAAARAVDGNHLHLRPNTAYGMRGSVGPEADHPGHTIEDAVASRCPHVVPTARGTTRHRSRVARKSLNRESLCAARDGALGDYPPKRPISQLFSTGCVGEIGHKTRAALKPNNLCQRASQSAVRWSGTRSWPETRGSKKPRFCAPRSGVRGPEIDAMRRLPMMAEPR